MLEKEIERAGIPAVLVTTLLSTARMLRANRVVPGIGITNPLGDPRLSPAEEKAVRKNITASALEALTRKAQGDDERAAQDARR